MDGSRDILDRKLENPKKLKSLMLIVGDWFPPLKKWIGGWVGGVSSIQFFLDVWIFFLTLKAPNYDIYDDFKWKKTPLVSMD